MAQGFEGFPDTLFEFLRDLAANNNRDWFSANKARYRETVVSPVSDFITAMAPHLAEISPHFVANPKANGGSMFRIYRDTRFSRNKQPYKTNVGCQFRHEAGRDAHAPGFYVHLEPGHVFFGAGLWMPPSGPLGCVRDAIVDRPDDWRKLIDNKAFVKRFGALGGDSLKRAPKGYDAEHPLIDDLKRKSFIALQTMEETTAMDKGFLPEVVSCFKTLSPFMRFLTQAQELPY